MDNQNENEREYNSNLSGGQPGIYSTPDLTVNPENIVLTGEVVSDSNQERIAAAFTQTGASNRARAIARANQNFRASVPFPSTATGDLNLQPITKKKSRLPLILLATFAVIAVIGGVVFVAVSGSGKDGGEEPAVSVEAAREQFNRFANYILYGEPSSVLTGSYTRGKSYELDVQAENAEYDSEFWNTALNLLNNTVNIYESLGDAANSSLLSFLKSYQQDFLFLNQYVSLKDLTVDALFETYIERGAEGTKNYISDYYYELGELESGYSESFAAKLILRDSLFINGVKYYDTAGCLADGQLNDECMDNLVLGEAAFDLFSDLNDARQSVISEGEDIVRNLEQSCWTISNWSQGPLEGEQ